MQCQIEISSRELIKPSSPTPQGCKHHKLSLLDQVSLPTYVPLLFFYENQNTASDIPRKNASKHFKQALSETLTRFYPLAGKLMLPDLDSVDCDGSGALFVEARVDASLSDTIQDAPYTHFARYLPFHPTAESIAGSYKRNEILVAVQITWFGCGGFAIGVCAAHKVADLASVLAFLSSCENLPLFSLLQIGISPVGADLRRMKWTLVGENLCVLDLVFCPIITTKDEEGIEAWVSLLPHELPLLSHHLLSLAATTFFH